MKSDPLVWDGNTNGDDRLGSIELSIGNGTEVARNGMDVLVSTRELDVGRPAHVVEVLTRTWRDT